MGSRGKEKRIFLVITSPPERPGEGSKLLNDRTIWKLERRARRGKYNRILLSSRVLSLFLSLSLSLSRELYKFNAMDGLETRRLALCQRLARNKTSRSTNSEKERGTISRT